MRIFFCGGGTMGPVTPLVATVDRLREIRSDIVPVWIGTRNGVERAFIAKQGIEYHWICAAKLRRYFDLRTLFIPFITAAAIVQSMWLLFMHRPSAVAVSGSFVQVPLVMTARLFGVPVILLQLDAQAGLANRISAYDAKTIVASLEISAPQFGRREVRVIGAPVRSAILELADPAKRAKARERGLARWNFDGSRPTILIVGGGTGAQSVNDFAKRNIDALIAFANILLVTGKGKMVEVSPRPNFAAAEFLGEELAEAYAVADLVLGRAGFATVSELGVLGLASVLIPLPGQQEKNARYLASKGAALAMKPGFTDDELLSTVGRLVHDRDRREEMGRLASGIFPSDAAEKFAEIILKTIGS